MYTVTITNHDAPKRFGHAVMPLPTRCFNCKTQHKAIYKYVWPGVKMFDGPKVCTCGAKLGCWTIMTSFTRGSARCYEIDPNHPELYRTRKDAAKAKKEMGL